MLRKAALSLLTATTAIVAVSLPLSAQEIETFRVGLLGGENEADRLKNNECLVEQLEGLLGVEVELFPAPDYAGVMQGLLAGQLDYAQLGAAGYAGIYLQDPDAVEPYFVSREIDGSLGYVSLMYTRADSGIESLEDMEGRSLAFADPNSTSGYLVPRAELQAAGIDVDSYFSRTGFGGGHEQAVIAVLNGQYDAGVTWSSGQGDAAEGYSRGNLRSMVDKGLLDMKDLRIIWQSNVIPNGPIVLRTDLPQDVKDKVVGWLETLHETDYECFRAITAGDGPGFARVDHSFFEGVVSMRRAEVEGSR